MQLRACTPTLKCCTRREIGPVDVEISASWCAVEVADEIKAGGTEMMPTAITDRPEIGGVEAMRTGKGNPPWNVGIVARKATGIASAGRSMPIRKEPGPDLVRDKSTK